jgi:3-oxoacyl-[acyl-carrier-protein] synthase-3
MNAVIKAISYYLPGDVLSNDMISTKFPDWSVGKIEEKTGIIERRIAAKEVFSSDLAVEAAKRLFEEHSIQPADIDFILLFTQSPDYFLPTTACLVQERLGIPKTAGALDINLGCSAYIYGLSIAKGLIETGTAKNILLITAETYSKFIHPEDKSSLTIFGDAAACTLLTEGDQGAIGPFVLGTDGKGAENLIVKNGGIRNPRTDAAPVVDEYENVRDDNSLFMNGSAIFNFTLREIPAAYKKLVEKAKVTADDIDLFIFHQANRFMLESLRRKMGIPEERFYIFISHCGNTVSSTIPIALYNAMKEGRAKKGDRVMLVGFGVGYSWGGTIVTL